ncbi:hypothetical protein [Streptomyces alboniger]|uniref:Uncharacterized protein n=1 Tax=Streptomyces alboniger TaxID=132473 RepID=A0A5J6HPL1_STRAD|nr:hypothetical protein [Streptomyces alboniger]QEV21132.1 hypothetical protein CP975_29480 [Streptomyces alboniger]
MRTVKFGESEIEVIDFEDATAGERVIEFRYRGDPTEASFAAIVVPDGGSWSSALLAIDPQAGDVSAPLMADLMEVARSLIEAR